MIFIQRSAGRSDSIVQQTNNFNQGRKGNLGGQNCSNREHEYIRRPNIVKTCFTCRRYTVKSHAWENQQHACYYGGTPKRHRKTACFETLVLEPHFAQSCGLFLLLYCILGWQSSLQASFHWKMQSVKLPVCPTPAGCICSNSGVTVEQFAQRASETGEQSFAIRYGDILRIVAKMLASPVPLASNVDLQGRKQGIHGFLFLRAFSTLPSWGQRGARQKPTEFAKEKRERKAPQPKARTESEEAGRERYGQGTLPS